MRIARRTIGLLASVSALVALSACATYHTTYTNLHPPGQDPVVDGGARLDEAGFFDGWEHFWIFGLLPLENRVDAPDECRAEPVEQIRTYQSGLQFLLANVQGAFIFVNVWSPYTAKVDCARDGGSSSAPPLASFDSDPRRPDASQGARQSEATFVELASLAAPYSRGGEAACRDACSEAHGRCVSECGNHRNPMECDQRCRRIESECRRTCGR